METILRRHYKNQQQKDLELCKVYQLGILDERKEWREKAKEFARKLNILKRQKEFCFCMGDRIYTPFCANCQDFFKLTKEDIFKLKRQIGTPTMRKR